MDFLSIFEIYLIVLVGNYFALPLFITFGCFYFKGFGLFEVDLWWACILRFV